MIQASTSFTSIVSPMAACAHLTILFFGRHTAAQSFDEFPNVGRARRLASRVGDHAEAPLVVPKLDAPASEADASINHGSALEESSWLQKMLEGEESLWSAGAHMHLVRNNAPNNSFRAVLFIKKSLQLQIRKKENHRQGGLAFPQRIRGAFVTKLLYGCRHPPLRGETLPIKTHHGR